MFPGHVTCQTETRGFGLLWLSAEAAVKGMENRIGASLSAESPHLARLQEAHPSAEPLGLRGLSGNQDGG